MAVTIGCPAIPHDKAGVQFLDRPRQREAAFRHDGTARKLVEGYRARSLRLCKAGRHSFSGWYRMTIADYGRNQLLACVDPVLGERLFSVIDRRVRIVVLTATRRRRGPTGGHSR